MNLGLEDLQGQMERLARLPSHYRLALVLLVPALVVTGYWWFLYRPAAEEQEGLVKRQQNLQRKLNEVRSVAANVDRFEEELEGLENELRLALRQLPDSKELPGLLTDISSLGKSSGLEFEAFRPQREVERDFYAEVPIEIEFTGGYHQVAVFFDRIAKLDRIVNVGDLQMSVQREDLDGTVLHVKGRVVTFRFLEEDAA